MMRRRLLSFAVLLAFAGSAAAQGVKIAGDPAADASTADAPKKAPAKPRKKSAKPKKKAEESKYKSRVLADGSESAYRFDENGNPLDGAAKKKSTAETKKKSSESEEKPACSDADSCSDKDKKSSDADAL